MLLRWASGLTALPALAGGSPINPGGMTALPFAVRQGHANAVSVLLDHGATLDERDAEGNTPLILAILNYHYDPAQALIDRGVDVSAATTAALLQSFAGQRASLQ